LVVTLKRGHHLGSTDLDRKILLKLTLKEQVMKVWNRFIWLSIGFNVGLL
jgi:hypothetical protein